MDYDPDAPLTSKNFPARYLTQRIEDATGASIDDFHTLLRLAALGVVNRYWRNGPVESVLHGGPWGRTKQTRLHDGDMMRMNSWLTSEVLDALIRWAAQNDIGTTDALFQASKDQMMALGFLLEGTLVLEEAEIAGYAIDLYLDVRTSTRDLKRELIPVYVKSRAREIATHARRLPSATHLGARNCVLLWVSEVIMSGQLRHSWWASVGWAETVRLFLTRSPEYKEYRERLLDSPWTIPTEVCQNMIHRGGIGYVYDDAHPYVPNSEG